MLYSFAAVKGLASTIHFRINVGPTLINYKHFSHPYALIQVPMLIAFWLQRRGRAFSAMILQDTSNWQWLLKISHSDWLSKGLPFLLAGPKFPSLLFELEHFWSISKKGSRLLLFRCLRLLIQWPLYLLNIPCLLLFGCLRLLGCE